MNMCCILMGLIILISFPVRSTTSMKYNISPPESLTFSLKWLQCLRVAWPPPNANCSIEYQTNVTGLSNNLTTMGSYFEPEFCINFLPNEHLYSNDRLLVQVHAKCNNQTIHSMNRTVQLAPGDDRMAVRNFSCFWLYEEYVRCTWLPEKTIPPNVSYKLFYWIDGKRDNGQRFYALEKFWDMLETGKMCQQSFSEGPHIGCQFRLKSNISASVNLITVVTDESKKIKPFIYYVSVKDIVKFKPPTINEAYWVPNNTIYVAWNAPTHTEFQVQLSASSFKPIQREANELSTTFPNLLPDVTYTVKIRAKLKWYLLHKRGHFFWSDWSEEKIVRGNNERTTSIILLVLIPSVVVIIAVCLLIHIKRFKKLLFPDIPDPANFFPKHLQQWLKSDIYNIHNRPENEEMCPVNVLETSEIKK